MSDQIAVIDDSIENSGLKIFYRAWHPRKVRACLVVVHGAGDQSAKYQHAGEYFSQKDFAVYAMDLRGNVNDFDEYIGDVSMIVEKAKNDYSDVPLFVLGHSMGGTISALYGISRPGNVQGILLSSPCMGFKFKVNPVKKWLSKAAGKLFPMISFPDGINPGWVSTRPEMRENQGNADEDCSKTTAAWYNAFQSAIAEAMAKAGNFSTPCMIMHEEDDILIEPSDSQQFYENISSEDKEFRLYNGCQQEIMNEPQREEVLQDIWEWIASRLN